MIKGNWKLDEATSDPDAVGIFNRFFLSAIPDIQLSTLTYSFTADACQITYNNIRELHSARYVKVGGVWYVECHDGGDPVYNLEIHDKSRIELVDDQRRPSQLYLTKR
jgi:hypothetical protein